MTGNGVIDWIGARTIDPRPSPSPAPFSRQQLGQNARVNSKKARQPSNRQVSSSITPAYPSDMNVAPTPVFSQPANLPPRQRTPAQSGYHSPYGKPPQHDDDSQERDPFDGSTLSSNFDDTISIPNHAEPQPRQGAGVNEEHRQADPADIYDRDMDADNQGQVDRGEQGYPDEHEAFEYQQVPFQAHSQVAHQRVSSQVRFNQSQTQHSVEPSYQNHQASPIRKKGTAISGRFAMAASTSRAAPPEVESSHKRARSQDRYMSPVVTKLTQSADRMEKEGRNGNTQQLSPISTETSDDATTRLRSDDGSDVESTDGGNSLQHQPQLQSRPISSIHRPESETAFDLGRIKPDYEDGVLRQMSYAELKEQSFDEIPKANETTIEPDISLSNLSLPERLAATVEQLHTGDERENEKRQESLAELFGAMPRDDWEESGDWFLARFADVVIKLKEARREKRRIVAEFEREMEARELAVRESFTAYSEDMERMKEGAETVIAGKRI
ncbi:extracellular mutant 11 domain-containing protein [Rutstroemia sp. NJR-2017a BVV2]|nr:extracellular mutant 11 domain-containing protein [Rutstroemia sp. NJR-2017a BVV2]